MSEIVVVITGATGPSGGGGGSTALDDLTDVVITAAASGDILRHNGTAWVDAIGTTFFEVAGAAAAAQAASQPLDSDLTAIAALTTTAYGRAFLTLANQAATMALLSAASDTASGIVELATNAETATGTDTTRAVTPANVASVLASYLTTSAAAAGYQPLDSDLTAIAALTTTAYGRAFLALADQAALMALLSAASDTASGIVELATTAETTTGTDTARAVTPAGLLNATTASNINARIAVKKAGSVQGTRRGINFIEGTNVTLTVADDAGNEEVDVTIAATGGGSGLIAGLAHAPMTKVGQYSRSYTSNGQSSAGATVLNRGYYVPLLVTEAMTIDRLCVSVSTAGTTGALIRLGIYGSDADGMPSNLVLDAGTVAADSTGVKEITISQALSVGVYWACAASQVALCSVHADSTLTGQAFLFNSTAQGYYNAPTLYEGTSISGAMPSTATPSPSAGQIMPIIIYRRSV